MLGEIDIAKKPYKPNIFLAKPNRTIIAKLTEAKNVKIKLNFGGLHEISFTIPYIIDRNHKLVRNSHADLILGHYLLKVDKEWFIITNPKKTGNGGKEELEVKAFLLPYELRTKRIPLYKSNPDPETNEALPVNAGKVLDDILEGTTWSKGYIDADFNLTYRCFDITEKTVLEFLQDIAVTFDAIILYDTDKKTINLYKQENLGIDKGLVIKYGKYLKSIDEEPNFDEVCTRLYAYGRDGITFNNINPTGQSYIEDYDYYMFPYSETITNEKEDKYIVNSSSKYMSDELCHAILKRQKIVVEKTPIFQNLLKDISKLEEQLTELNNQFQELENQLALIEDSLDMANKTSRIEWGSNLIKYPKDEREKLCKQRDNKKKEIESKSLEIKAKSTEIESKFNEINILQNEINPNKFFTKNTIEELLRFTIQKKWSDENITDTKILYERTQKELIKVSQPRINYNIDMIDFLQVVECQRDWNKLKLGDIVTVKYPFLNISIKAKIISIVHDSDKGKINVIIANSNDIKDGFFTIKDLVKNVNNTSTILDISKFKWESGGTAKGKVEQLIDTLMDRNKEKILSGKNESYSLDRTGMTFKDPNDPLNYLRILHNVIAFTNDGGNSFKTAISPDGVVAEYLYGKIITGVNLIIGDKDGTMQIKGNKGLVTDWLDRVVMKWGLYDGYITEDNHDDDKFGLELIRYEDDTTNIKNKITLDAEEGFFIKKIMKEGINAGQFKNTAWLDTSGNFWLEEVTARRMTIYNGNDEAIIDVGVDVSDTRLNIEKFNEILTDGVLSPLEKYQVRAEWERIQAEYIKLDLQAKKYDMMEREDEKDKHHTRTQWDKYNTAYQTLKTYIEPYFIDMENNSLVIRKDFETNFKNYYDSMKDLVHAIEDAIKLSSVQLGHNYNNVVMDAKSGIVVTRDDGIIKTVLNATEGIYIENDKDRVFYVDIEGNLRLRGNLINRTRNGRVEIKIDLDEGFSISKYGDKKFWVDTDGNLFSHDMTADRLILRDDKGDVIIDANSGFLNLNKFHQIAGALQPENIVTRTFKAGTGFIADLTVNHLTTIDNDEAINRNYIDIAGNKARWISAEPTGATTQAKDVTGCPLWWTDEKHTSTTTIEEDGVSPVMEKAYNDITKLLITFDEYDPNAIPYILFGTGDGTNSLVNKGLIKKSDGFFDFLIQDNMKRNFGIRAHVESTMLLVGEMQRARVCTTPEITTWNDGNSRVVATRIIGSGAFKSFVPHTIGHTNYVVEIIPTSNTGGYVGEWWVEKTASGFTIQNTGSSTATFDYVILC